MWDTFCSRSKPSEEKGLAILEPVAGVHPEAMVIPWPRKDGRDGKYREELDLGTELPEAYATSYF